MKRISIFMATIVMFGLLSIPSTYAQFGMGRGGGWGMGGQYQRKYNPATVETISGEVVSVDSITPLQGMSGGVHLQLKTPKEEISVHLGPAWYLNNQDMQIQLRDKIEVKGSRIVFSGQPTLIAAEVKKNDRVLKLRDLNGFHIWSGWRNWR